MLAGWKPALPGRGAAGMTGGGAYVVDEAGDLDLRSISTPSICIRWGRGAMTKRVSSRCCANTPRAPALERPPRFLPTGHMLVRGLRKLAPFERVVNSFFQIVRILAAGRW